MAARRLYEEVLPRVETFMRDRGETDNFQLNRAGKALLGNKFAGVFAADDRLTVSRQRPYAIVNGSTRASGGTHWFGVCFYGSNNLLCSDSFGRPIRNFSEDYNALTRNGRLRIRNSDRRPEQRVRENNCGQRSLTWLIVCDRLGPHAAAAI
jgi:hypothetical protein